MSYTMTGDSVTVVLNGNPYTVAKGAPNFSALRKALDGEDWKTAKKYLTVAGTVSAWSKGDFRVIGSDVRVKDEVLPREMGQRIVSMVTRNEDPSSVLNFWTRLRRNPSARSVQQLWSFLSHRGIPLTEDGHFLAYKSVRKDYKDHHSGTVDNKIGVVNEMPRNKISDDPREACHEGYHVGALNYAQGFGGSNRRIIVCKVDPADVVCVPYDSSQEKMRVCRYEVVGHHGAELPSTSYSHPGATKKAAKPSVVKPATGRSKFDRMDKEKLLEQPISDLRKYAALDLGIKGASKIPGGKKALVAKVMKTRMKTRKKLRKKAAKKAAKRAAKRAAKPKVPGWSKFNRMSEEDLLDQPIADLRKYAALGLLIYGASKIPGGKLTLVGRIMEVRGEE
jgi:hypothetical protein